MVTVLDSPPARRTVPTFEYRGICLRSVTGLHVSAAYIYDTRPFRQGTLSKQKTGGAHRSGQLLLASTRSLRRSADVTLRRGTTRSGLSPLCTSRATTTSIIGIDDRGTSFGSVRRGPWHVFFFCLVFCVYFRKSDPSRVQRGRGFSHTARTGIHADSAMRKSEQ